jgi:hypothetical protein
MVKIKLYKFVDNWIWWCIMYYDNWEMGASLVKSQNEQRRKVGKWRMNDKFQITI